jgi:hypothetical protein
MKSEKDGDLVKMSEVLKLRAESQAITLPNPFNIDLNKKANQIVPLVKICSVIWLIL